MAQIFIWRFIFDAKSHDHNLFRDSKILQFLGIKFEIHYSGPTCWTWNSEIFSNYTFEKYKMDYFCV